MPIDWLTLGAALLAGLMGSVHCFAMCGGIATGFSVAGGRAGWWPALQPNLGRVLGYVLAGALVGAFGQALVQVFQNQSVAVVLRASVGLVLVFVALRLLFPSARLPTVGLSSFRLWRLLQPIQRRLLPANTVARRLTLGMLWGWMPCGLSSTMLVAAWLQADWLNAAGTMAAFGLGTLPLMLPLTWSGARLGQGLQRPRWRRTLGGLVLGAGLLTIAAPWLVHAPALHGVLAALGCLPPVR